MRLLLVGANGQLGRSFLIHGGLAQLGELTATTRDGQPVEGVATEVADLGEPASLTTLLDRLRPELIINTAAYTAVDKAEQEEALATRINGEAPGVLAQWAAKHHALLVHFSTDYVFSGDATEPYPVDAATGPLGAYGRSKLAGEQAIGASGAAHLLFRTAWVYAPHGQNFLRTMLRVGAERDELRVVADQMGAPTSTQIIVEGSLAAIRTWLAADPGERASLQGTHHLVASGHTSWHAFAQAIFVAASSHGLITRQPNIIPIATSEYPTPAKRPSWSVLDNSGFQQRFGHPLAHWQQGLEDVIQALSPQAR